MFGKFTQQPRKIVSVRADTYTLLKEIASIAGEPLIEIVSDAIEDLAKQYEIEWEKD